MAITPQSIFNRQTSITRLPTNQPFQFLKLPAELRDEVYRSLLVLNAPIYVRGDKAPKNSRYIVSATTGKWELSMPLLKTSSQLRDEAMSILYSENSFRAYNLNSLRMFCSTIGPRAMSCIGTLTVGNQNRRRWSGWRTAIDDDYRHSTKFFSQTTNLRSLTLLMEIEYDRLHYIPTPLPKPGALLSKEQSLEMLPCLLPNIPRTVVDAWFRADGLKPEVIFEVTMRVRWLSGGQIKKDNIRYDRYRLAPNSTAGVGRGLSQIGKNYNLVYIEFESKDERSRQRCDS